MNNDDDEGIDARADAIRNNSPNRTDSESIVMPKEDRRWDDKTNVHTRGRP